jgi:hypothetical protein
MDASSRPLTFVAGGGVPAQAREAERRLLRCRAGSSYRAKAGRLDGEHDRTLTRRALRADLSRWRGRGEARCARR